MTNMQPATKFPHNLEVAAIRLGTDLTSLTDIPKKLQVWTKMCKRQGFTLETIVGSIFIASAVKLKQKGNVDCVYTARLMGKYFEVYYQYIHNNAIKPDFDVKEFLIKQYEMDQLTDPSFIVDPDKAINKALKGIEAYLKNRNASYGENGGLYGKDF